MALRFLALTVAEDLPLFKEMERYFASMKSAGLVTLHRIGESPDEDGAALVREADVVVVLLTPRLVASTVWQGPAMLEARADAESGRLRVLPFVLEPCPYDDSWLGSRVALPRSGPLSRARDRGEAWMSIVSDLRHLVQAIVAEKAAN